MFKSTDSSITTALDSFLVDRFDFPFRFRDLRSAREKCNEVPIFHLRLHEGALCVPRVGYGELRPRHVIGVRIAVDEGFERKARRSIFRLLHGLHGAVEQYFVRLFYADISFSGGSLCMTEPEAPQE